jgi:hypothetical protein
MAEGGYNMPSRNGYGDRMKQQQQLQQQGF